MRSKKVLQLGSRGKFEQNEWTKLLKRHSDPLMFNQETGELRWKGDQDTSIFEVVQAGTSSNGVNAVRSFQGPAAYVHSFLSIETFTDGWPFYFDDDGTIYTGTCVAG